MPREKRYDNPDPSVTQVLAVLRKIGLEMWFKKNTAKFCNEKSKRGLQIGKEIHEGIHDLITTGKLEIKTQYGEEVQTAMKSFMAFRKDHPEFKLRNAEVKMHSLEYKCNGTLDCEADEGDTAVLLDWKTGECKYEANKKTGEMEWKHEVPPIFPEAKYQVAAYVKFYNEIFKANIQTAYILALAKDRVAYNLIKVEKQELEEGFFQVFLPAMHICNYQKTHK